MPKGIDYPPKPKKDESDGDEPITMKNPALNRAMGLTDNSKVFEKADEPGIVMNNPVLSRQAGLKNNRKLFAEGTPSPKSSADPSKMDAVEYAASGAYKDALARRAEIAAAPAARTPLAEMTPREQRTELKRSVAEIDRLIKDKDVTLRKLEKEAEALEAKKFKDRTSKAPDSNEVIAAEQRELRALQSERKRALESEKKPAPSELDALRARMRSEAERSGAPRTDYTPNVVSLDAERAKRAAAAETETWKPKRTLAEINREQEAAPKAKRKGGLLGALAAALTIGAPGDIAAHTEQHPAAAPEAAQPFRATLNPGEGGDALVKRLQDELKAVYHDAKHAPDPVARKLMETNPHVLSQAFHFVKGERSALLQPGDTLTYTKDGHVEFQAKGGKKSITFMQLSPDHKSFSIKHTYEGRMMPGSKYHVRSTTVHHGGITAEADRSAMIKAIGASHGGIVEGSPEYERLLHESDSAQANPRHYTVAHPRSVEAAPAHEAVPQREVASPQAAPKPPIETPPVPPPAPRPPAPRAFTPPPAAAPAAPRAAEAAPTPPASSEVFDPSSAGVYTDAGGNLIAMGGNLKERLEKAQHTLELMRALPENRTKTISLYVVGETIDPETGQPDVSPLVVVNGQIGLGPIVRDPKTDQAVIPPAPGELIRRVDR